MYTVTFTFNKTGLIRFISHLDLMRLLMRALRRAEMPLALSQGFNPHPKLSFGRALKLGLASESEQAQVVLTRMLDPQDFLEGLNNQLPHGIRILSATIA